MLDDLFRVKDSICDLPPVNSQVNREVSEGYCLKAVKGASPLISPDIPPSCESFFADEVNVGSPDASVVTC
jgi:hypothetical protein